MRTKFGIESERYWRGLVRSPDDFHDMDIPELERQVEAVCRQLASLGKNTLLLPPTFSSENLSAYLGARWKDMSDSYRTCAIPWNAVDVMATGDLAPCHILFDLTMGNLYEHSFEELWNSEKYRSFREHIEHNGLMSICPGCCVLYLAGS